MKLSDLLLSPKKAERHPIEIIVVCFIYASLSIFLSLWIFPDYASLVMVFFTVISCVYVVQGAFILEEDSEEEVNSEEKLFQKHVKLLVFLMALFLGFLLAFAFWKIILPDHINSQIFMIQESVVTSIRSITGKAISPVDSFWPILKNNLGVLFFSLIFAVVYGAGAIFILAWNASTLGYAIGESLINIASLKYMPSVLVKYFLHGIPEMLAYFAAALAGGIIYISFVRGENKKSRLKRISIDVTLLIVASIALLITAATLETLISPLF